MTQQNYEKITVVKAIMNNKGYGLPTALDTYSSMTNEERNNEVKKYISYGGKI